LIAARPTLLFAGLIILAAAAFLVALSSGSADTSLSETLSALAGTAPGKTSSLIMELRLPRALTAFSVGGLLAIAGVLMQVLLRNPLAEPYILGSSGGAAVAALAAMLLGLGRLLLTGVVLAAGFSAATTLMLALSPDQNLRGMLFWLMGDLSWALILLVFASTLAARHLNVLSRGELQAAIVGMPVVGFRYLVFAAASLATALAVTTVGVIGFIGLVVPHLVRLLAGSDHRIVVPASALAGGILLVIADTLARTIMAPRQLPVGALTAMIGVPLFLLLMGRSRDRRQST